ncbi:phage terminase large subunit [Hymenobacter monticola]|uniref:Phage terminase large subunit n=1 Tax=Hymenobacter monticola TaxID=1705399 RepID=A0ABY4B497_9BACT|nr:phage terminase large subunit [Hymenobacter monticola]UOE32861.1 phage terminase large subunit [Hymenobacter monticola]
MPRKKKEEALLPPSPLEVNRAIYKQSFYQFYKDAFKVLEPNTDYQDNWHVKYLCDVLQEETERIARKETKQRDIIINIPFRSSKSLICTVVWPAWVWCKYPTMKFIAASYSNDLSLELATKSRDLLQSDWLLEHFPDVQLKKDNNNKSGFENTKTGVRVSTSVGGTVTGKGADVILIDDPIDPRRASSEVEIKNANDWYNGTVYSRLNNFRTGVRIIIMQRLHENDLSGHLLKKNPEGYRHICIPATDEDPRNIKPVELREKYVDGLFWPDRFTRAELLNFKSSLGSKGYSQQLMQRAVESEGGMFKRDWFKNISAEDFRSRCDGKAPVFNVFIDSAETDKKDNDATGIVLAATIGADLYIKEVIAERKVFTDLIRFLKEWLPKYLSSTSKVHIEGKSSGKSLISQLKAETSWNVVEVQPGRDAKVVRAESVTPMVEGGRVFLIEGDWIEDFLEEICSFPLAAHDDTVDAFVYACKHIKSSSSFWYGSPW